MEKIAERVREEREDVPDLLIFVHTHPNGGNAELSKRDRERHAKVASKIEKLLPDANLLFGVHRMSGEGEVKEKPVRETGENKIEWNSNTRKHEIAIFTPDSDPYPVKLARVKNSEDKCH